MSRDLATIVRHMQIDCDLDDYVVKEVNRTELIPLYQRLQFNNFLSALQETARTMRRRLMKWKLSN